MSEAQPGAYILDEIREQPAALERTLHGELEAIKALKARLARHPPRLILLAARGTSDNAALFGKYLLEITTGIPVSLAAPSIFTLYDAPFRFDGVLTIAISQSGESTDTNAVLERALQAGAPAIGITNEAGSALARLAEYTFLVRAGREKSVAATKTYTGQLMLLYLLAYALGAPIDLEELARIPEWAHRALGLEKQIRQQAGYYLPMERAVVAGRGLNYANAFEFALKLMETCYVIAARFSAADLLHGPIAMVEPSFPAFLFAPAGPAWPGIREVLEKLDTLQAESLVITDRSNPAAAQPERNVWLVDAELPEIYTPIPYIIPAQLFSALLSLEKGLDPDRPRTLSKITRTR